jgi:hypothetical protein
MANKNLTIPKDLSSLQSNGSLPSSDGAALYFFNPEEHNATSNQWNYTHEIWKLNMDGIVSKMDISLPDDIQMVIPIQLGKGFFSIPSQNMAAFFGGARYDLRGSITHPYLIPIQLRIRYRMNGL